MGGSFMKHFDKSENSRKIVMYNRNIVIKGITYKLVVKERKKEDLYT